MIDEARKQAMYAHDRKRKDAIVAELEQHSAKNVEAWQDTEDMIEMFEQDLQDQKNIVDMMFRDENEDVVLDALWNMDTIPREFVLEVMEKYGVTIE